jgi:hypothetical protein
MFWQLTVDATDPERLAAFWGPILGYQPAPPADADTTWYAHYRRRLGEATEFTDRLFDPTGQGPPIWFQSVPESKAGKNRLHLDLYVTGRDDAMPQATRVAVIDAKVSELVTAGAVTVRSERGDDPGDSYYFVVMQDPEGNEFCVS